MKFLESGNPAVNRDCARARSPSIPEFGVRKLHTPQAVDYHFKMQIASGTIIGGKVVVEGLSLPEGTVVTVLARGDEVAVRLPLQQEAELLDALDEADREEGISADELSARLRRFGWHSSREDGPLL